MCSRLRRRVEVVRFLKCVGTVIEKQIVPVTMKKKEDAYIECGEKSDKRSGCAESGEKDTQMTTKILQRTARDPPMQLQLHIKADLLMIREQYPSKGGAGWDGDFFGTAAISIPAVN